jgi:hypothetical protein
MHVCPSDPAKNGERSGRAEPAGFFMVVLRRDPAALERVASRASLERQQEKLTKSER